MEQISFIYSKALRTLAPENRMSGWINVGQVKNVKNVKNTPSASQSLSDVRHRHEGRQYASMQANSQKVLVKHLLKPPSLQTLRLFPNNTFTSINHSQATQHHHTTTTPSTNPTTNINMSDHGRKDLSDKVADKITPDTTKSTVDKAGDHVTGKADKVGRDAVPDSECSIHFHTFEKSKFRASH